MVTMPTPEEELERALEHGAVLEAQGKSEEEVLRAMIEMLSPETRAIAFDKAKEVFENFDDVDQDEVNELLSRIYKH